MNADGIVRSESQGQLSRNAEVQDQKREDTAGTAVFAYLFYASLKIIWYEVASPEIIYL